MQISARYQAVYELLTEIFKNKYPADNLINNYMRQRKYIGSKDRRFIVDTVWQVIRNRMKLEFDIKSANPRDVLLCYLKEEDFDIIADGSEYGLAKLTKEERQKLNNLSKECYPDYVEAECPEWIYKKIGNPALVKSLNGKAPADVRANMENRDAVRNKLKNEGLFFSLMPYSPYGLRSEDRLNLQNCIAYKEGLIEVQDEASQLAALLSNVSADDKVIDYCAGAGGKSLAMAAINRNEGVIYAHDADWNRMDAIKERASRLGIKNIRLVREVTDTDFDKFIIDAPCSGTGTWRRSPDAKFRLSPERLAELVKTQAEILETAYHHTKTGGYIVYITCSVLPDENEQQVLKFKNKHKNIEFVNHKQLWQKKVDKPYPFASSEFLQFSPLVTDTDGFFFCMMRKL